MTEHWQQLGAHPSIKKSYENLDFLNSPQARLIRVLCEMVEPEVRFRKHRIRDTIVFFGSARLISKEDAQVRLKNVQNHFPKEDPPSEDLSILLREAERGVTMSRYYEDAVQLSEKLTRWSLSIPNSFDRFFVCSGGGPGIMEAAAKGAALAGGPSIGLNISLPCEQTPNPYQIKELSFDFHYFFIRKFWFFYLAKALVVFPGGFGTCDELFELLTLVQTKKSKKYMPIIIYGTDYWKEIFNFDAMVKWGTISEEDLRLFHFFDDVDETFEFLKNTLTRVYLEKSEPKSP